MFQNRRDSFPVSFCPTSSTARTNVHNNLSWQSLGFGNWIFLKKRERERDREGKNKRPEHRGTLISSCISYRARASGESPQKKKKKKKKGEKRRLNIHRAWSSLCTGRAEKNSLPPKGFFVSGHDLNDSQLNKRELSTHRACNPSPTFHLRKCLREPDRIEKAVATECNRARERKRRRNRETEIKREYVCVCVCVWSSKNKETGKGPASITNRP